jgi:hypothetical protein
VAFVFQRTATSNFDLKKLGSGRIVLKSKRLQKSISINKTAHIRWRNKEEQQQQKPLRSKLFSSQK